MRGTSPRYFGGARRDSGATAIEYAALVGVGAALVVVLVLVVSNPLATGMKRALCDLFHLGCTSEEFEYKPPGSLCIAGIDTRSVGGSVTILSIGVGQNFQLVKTKFGDGTIRVRIVPVDYSLSAEAELGGGVKFGKKTYGGEAGASIEGSLGFKYGDMWEFDSEEEANKWLDDMKWDLARILAAWGAALIVWLLGFAIVARLSYGAPEGESFSGVDRMLRFDLPWVAISALMVVAAGFVHRDRLRRVRWLAAVLAVPLVAIAAGMAAPVAGDGGMLATVLYVAEGAAGAAAGLAAAVAVGTGTDEDSGYW